MTNKEIIKAYPIQDDVWASRRWNKDRTDYCDLSGHEEMEDIKIPQSLFAKYAFVKAGMKYYMAETVRLKAELEAERKRSTDFLYKNNQLTTKNIRLKERLGDPIEQFERELFSELN